MRADCGVEIIAVRAVKEVVLRRFWEDWGAVHGVMSANGQWKAVYVEWCAFWAGVADYAMLMSMELEKQVVYIEGGEGTVEVFCIYELGIYCPVSRHEADALGKTRLHPSWYIQNRLKVWGIPDEKHDAIMTCIREYDSKILGDGTYERVERGTVTRLANVLLGALGLPALWTPSSIEEVMKAASCKTIQ